MYRLFSLILIISSLVIPVSLTAPGQAAQTTIEILDIQGKPVTTITDGDAVEIKVTLSGSSSTGSLVQMFLDNPEIEIARCQVEPGSNNCQTPEIITLGWSWLPGGKPAGQHQIHVITNGSETGETGLAVKMRPVVMVHGFSSSWEAWTSYLGPDGYLARSGLPGFAVGDGQFSGVMNTGNIAQPETETNTIAENAAILGEYIHQVKKETGAQMVDLLAHSMGGLISRYYIDSVMQKRDVAQLIMLGSPMAGTDCANLPASLGLYLPAVLEIRPEYVNGIFNQQFYHRHGVNFHALAGNPIIRPVQSPCTGVPSDIAVARDSVAGIPLDLTELPILHTELNTSQVVFGSYVLPLLQTPAGSYIDAQDTPPAIQPAPDLQFSRIFTGHVNPAGAEQLTIFLEPGLAVANFAMYDPTHSLETIIQGASGNVIALDVEKNGVLQVDDPEMLFHLGYGFENPRPGTWTITIQAGPNTPSQGADYAILARFQGGYDLQARVEPVIALPGQTVKISAWFDPALDDLQVDEARAMIRVAGAETREISLNHNQGDFSADWVVTEPGIYGIDLVIHGTRSDGTVVERAAYLSAEVQQPVQTRRIPFIMAGVALAGLCILVLAILVTVFLFRRLRQR